MDQRPAAGQCLILSPGVVFSCSKHNTFFILKFIALDLYWLNPIFMLGILPCQEKWRQICFFISWCKFRALSLSFHYNATCSTCSNHLKLDLKLPHRDNTGRTDWAPLKLWTEKLLTEIVSLLLGGFAWILWRSFIDIKIKPSQLVTSLWWRFVGYFSLIAATVGEILHWMFISNL